MKKLLFVILVSLSSMSYAQDYYKISNLESKISALASKVRNNEREIRDNKDQISNNEKEISILQKKISTIRNRNINSTLEMSIIEN